MMTIFGFCCCAVACGQKTAKRMKAITRKRMVATPEWVAGILLPHPPMGFILVFLATTEYGARHETCLAESPSRWAHRGQSGAGTCWRQAEHHSGHGG